MTVEDRLARAMRQAAEPITPPIDRLVSGGVARGERMRHRHMVRLAGGLLTLAVVAAGATVAVAATMDRDDVAASRTDDSVASPSSARSRADVVVDTVVGLLPSGKVSNIRSNAESDHLVWFELVYDDGAGPSLIQGSVRFVGKVSPFECAPVITNGGTCDTRSLGDGTELMLSAGPYYPQPDREPERLLWRVSASRPDGLSISLGEINARTEKNSEITRPRPPLSLKQLTAMVTSDRWTPAGLSK